MNHCSCGAKLGDFYMHDEPGAPFFATEPEHCRGTTLIELVNFKPIVLQATFSMSSVNPILEHSKRKRVKLV